MGISMGDERSYKRPRHVEQSRDEGMIKTDAKTPIVYEGVPLDEQPKFEYTWSSYELDPNITESTLKRCGCDCSDYNLPCVRGFCPCFVGNVILTKNYRVRNTVRLSRSFYGSYISECGPYCQCVKHGRCNFRHPLLKHYLVVRKIEGKGLGVFTKSAIMKGSFVIEVAGSFIPYRDGRDWRYDHHILRFDLQDPLRRVVQPYEPCLYIDARHYGNESRFINHSCDPNLCLLQSYTPTAGKYPPRILLIALRDINVGEELTWNYGRMWITTMSEDDKKFFCRCGSKNCYLPAPRKMFREMFKDSVCLIMHESEGETDYELVDDETMPTLTSRDDEDDDVVIIDYKFVENGGKQPKRKGRKRRRVSER